MQPQLCWIDYEVGEFAVCFFRYDCGGTLNVLPITVAANLQMIATIGNKLSGRLEATVDIRHALEGLIGMLAFLQHDLKWGTRDRTSGFIDKPSKEIIELKPIRFQSDRIYLLGMHRYGLSQNDLM